MEKICKNCSKCFNVTRLDLIKSKVFCSLPCSQEWWMKKKNKTGKFIGFSKKAGIISRKLLNLNSNQYQLILGSMLGDGCIVPRMNKSGTSYHYVETHSIDQEDYLLHKMKVLKGFVVQKNLTNIRPNGFSLKNKVSLNSIVHPDFKKIFFLFHKKSLNEKGKIIKMKTLKTITPLGLIYWYLDDGDLSKKNSIKISTHSFGKKGNCLLQKWLFASFKITSVISLDKRKNLFYLRLNKDDTIKFLKIISPFKDIIPVSMHYKLLLR